MSAWVLLTIAGAFLQNLRSLLQRQLTEELSLSGAAYVRFLFALPFAWFFLALISQFSHIAAPSLDLEFWLYVLSGAVTQIIATSALVAAVSGSHFALGTALSKTEATQAALLGLFILGEGVGPMAMAGIGISLVGVFLLPRVQQPLPRDARSTPPSQPYGQHDSFRAGSCKAFSRRTLARAKGAPCSGFGPSTRTKRSFCEYADSPLALLTAHCSAALPPLRLVKIDCRAAHRH